MYNISYDGIDFGPGEPTLYDANLIQSSSEKLQSFYDVLLFFDSKGITTKNAEDEAFGILLAKHLEQQNLSCLLVCRPKNLTVFFTLINFLSNNAIRFDHLVTNLGFVDLTPKKREFLDDILRQGKAAGFNTGELVLRKLSTYQLSTGEEENLYTIDYGSMSDEIGAKLSAFFRYGLLCGVLEFSPDIPIERKRPKEFFSQLKITNRLLFDLADAVSILHYVQPLKAQVTWQPMLSYDAVHFTETGHRFMADLLLPYLDVFMAKNR